MEKLEKHVKKELETREIIPSKDAWEKISHQLEPEHKKGAGFSYKYAVAAGFIGLLIASLFFLNTQSETEPIQLVDENNEEVPVLSTDKKNVGVAKEITTDAIVEVVEDEPKESISNQPINIVPKVLNANEIASKQEVDQLILDDANPLISEKINEVFAQVALLEQINENVSDAEVDSLLRAAQAEIIKEKVFQDNGSIDAMALLTEVEDELDASLRDQLFDTLKDGYFKLRTAVADRNN